MKRNIKWAALVAATVASAFTSSCKKDQEISKSGVATVNNSSKIAMNGAAAQELVTDDPSNPANPYDSAGLFHNNGLIATQSVWSDTTATFDDLYAAVQTYVGGVLGSESDMQTDLTTIINDLPDNLAQVIPTFPLSAAGESYFSDLVNVATDFDAVNTYADWKAAVIAVETTVSNDKNLSSDDKSAILAAASIVRYSVKYWANYFYATDPSGFDFNSISGNISNTTNIAASFPTPGQVWRGIKHFFSTKLGKGIAKVGASDLAGGGGKAVTGSSWGTIIGQAIVSSASTGIGMIGGSK